MSARTWKTFCSKLYQAAGENKELTEKGIVYIDELGQDFAQE